MLLHQGAAAFTLWTGQPAPLDLMQQKLAEARAGGLRSAEGEPTGAAGAMACRRPAERAPTDRPTGTIEHLGPMGAFRFLTAGESHGPTLGVTIEGVPAGLALTADALAVDLARRQRGYGRGARQAIEQDRAEILAGVRHGTTLGSPILLLVRNRDWENWTEVMAVEPLDDEAAGRAPRRGRRTATSERPRSPACGPVTPTWPGPSSTASTTSATSSSAPRRARPRPASRPAASRARSCASSASRPGRSPPRSAASRSTRRTATPVARGGRRLAAALPGPRRRGRDDRPHRRGALGRRHGRWRVRGRRPRAADRARVVRPLGSPARRRAGRGGHEHQHRQGRRVRARVRADAPLRVGRPRRHRGPRRRRRLGPPDEQRGRPDRRRHQRRAARRARRGQADLDAGPAAAVGRPDHRRGGRQGALRAERHQRRPGRRRRRRGDGDAHAGRLRDREVRRRHARRRPGEPRALPGAHRGDSGRPGRRRAAAGRRRRRTAAGDAATEPCPRATA